ncbi:MAG TPA: hypothetical protein VEI03_15985 [Stellaceae bacterium]|nr:hypothetical protein [Stellaceae bacterium]
MFGGLGAVIIDELHALAGSKRGDLLARIKGRITHRRLERVSPLAVPVLLEIGREAVYGNALDQLLDDVTQELLAEAGLAPHI